MAFTNATLQDLYALLKTKGDWVGLLKDATTEVTGGSYGRVQTVWPTGTNGSGAGSQVAINVPAGTTVTHLGVFSAASGGSPIGVEALPTPLTYNDNGTALVTPTEAVIN